MDYRPAETEVLRLDFQFFSNISYLKIYYYFDFFTALLKFTKDFQI